MCAAPTHLADTKRGMDVLNLLKDVNSVIFIPVVWLLGVQDVLNPRSLCKFYHMSHYKKREIANTVRYSIYCHGTAPVCV